MIHGEQNCLPNGLNKKTKPNLNSFWLCRKKSSLISFLVNTQNSNGGRNEGGTFAASGTDSIQSAMIM